MTLSIETVPEAGCTCIHLQSMLLSDIEERYADAKLNIFSKKWYEYHQCPIHPLGLVSSFGMKWKQKVTGCMDNVYWVCVTEWCVYGRLLQIANAALLYPPPICCTFSCKL